MLEYGKKSVLEEPIFFFGGGRLFLRGADGPQGGADIPVCGWNQGGADIPVCVEQDLKKSGVARNTACHRTPKPHPALFHLSCN